MSENSKPKVPRTYSKKTAISILIAVIVPTIFILIVLGVAAPFLLPIAILAIVVAVGLFYRARPEFFKALKKGEGNKAADPIKTKPFPSPSSGSKRSYIMLVSVSQVNKYHITIDSSPFVIGRSDRANFCLQDEHVSNEHVVIDYDEKDMLCYATDKSSNGTYLNSVRMQRDVRRPLRPGDTLRIAGLLFRVEYVHF